MDLADQLSQFKGTTQYHSYYLSSNRSLFLTDGCQYLLDHLQCNWFFDHIINANLLPELKEQQFQVWTVKWINELIGLLWCHDGNGDILYGSSLKVKQNQVKSLTIWVVENIALLPNEY